MLICGWGIKGDHVNWSPQKSDNFTIFFKSMVEINKNSLKSRLSLLVFEHWTLAVK